MRESTFIFRNKERWESVEDGEEKSSDELADDFVELVNDLSYAKTNYPNSKLTAYLNVLSSKLYKR
ncbi:MAG: stage II sporulation protein M, partial [Spirosomaceae bacterium]|nr:stage II sporulation protein M [Spirosomataceae bacterium]